MKQWLCTAVGVIGGAAAWAFGGWDAALAALTICMSVDYISGSIVALVFHNSSKTASGAYNSAYGLKGLSKKCLMLLFVMVAVQMDKLTGSAYIRDAVCIGFCSNEVLSIIENLGLAGIPMPQAMARALEQLQKK
ncbi:MAG: phage holin family protein [Oscillospiraceae bacterium]|nr:phage holin family protein [Oscillospiraceae bacterium]